MDAYNGTSKQLKDIVVGLLQDIQLGGESAFAAVLDNSKGEFDKYPVAEVLPGTITDRPSARTQQDRVVAFTVWTYLPLEGVSQVPTETYDQMYNLTDLVVDTLDQANYDGSLSPANDGNVKVLSIGTTMGDWFSGNSKRGALLMASINVEIRYTKSVA